MSLTSLPRELKLIIDDIANQNNHLLEWEVFGNATEDMRIVLTWRRLEKKKTSPRRGSLGKWKLRQSSVTIDEPGEILEDGFGNSNKKDEHWNTTQKGAVNSDDIQEENEKARALDARKTASEEAQRKFQEEEDEKERQAQEAKSKREEERARRRIADEEEDERRLLELERKTREKQEREQKKIEKEERVRKEEEIARKIAEEKERKKQADEERRRKEEETERKNKKEKEEQNEIKMRDEEERKRLENERRKREEAEIRRLEDEEDEEERQRLENAKKRKLEAEERRRKEIEEENEEERLREEERLTKKDERRKKAEEEERKRQEAEELNEYKRLKEEAERKKTVAEEEEKKAEKTQNPEGEEEEGEGEEVKNVPSKKKKNPFRKLKKDEKIRTKGKLQLSLSIDESNLEKMDEENSSSRRKKVLSAEEQELVDRLLQREKNETNEAEADSERVKSEEAAKRILNMQRQRYQMSIDESAFDSLDATNDLDILSGGGSTDVRKSMTNISETDYDDEHHIKKKTNKEKKINSAYDETLVRITPLSDVVLGKTGWEKCADCRYNGFCDDLVHKAEYMTIILTDLTNDSLPVKECGCYVCKSGAVHNGCVYRELLRLKTEYRLFDKRNLCFCEVCIPFKYRKMCLRQELRLLRAEKHDLYYRLTYHGEDGNEGYHPAEYDDSSDSNYHSDEEISKEEVINAMCIDDLDIEITKVDKLDFRKCIDCQFNGFCDDIRHKKLYMMLLLIDDEDFEELEDTCGCLTCDYNGAAHSGCAEREIKRLKYDLLLFDSRNLCVCRQCVPFKYRVICLRQEMKQLRRKRAINLYNKLKY